MYANHRFSIATPASTTEPYYVYAVHAKALCQIAELLPVAMLNTLSYSHGKGQANEEPTTVSPTDKAAIAAVRG